MKLVPLPPGGLRLRLDVDEARLLDGLVTQLTALLHSHSGTALDPDPLFANLEIGGTDTTPDDPALARLFPDAFADAAQASSFRQLTEQGLVNRKLYDALEVTGALGLGSATDTDSASYPSTGFEYHDVLDVDITAATMPAWVRTLTSLRLAIAARIGLNEEDDHARLFAGEETRGTVMVYDWLAAILDSVLHMAEE